MIDVYVSQWIAMIVNLSLCIIKGIINNTLVIGSAKISPIGSFP